ncbi:PREDICTED: putative phosphatidate phosphatase isoform X1 [Trachymyrmex septentrionalis]|uniref:putative phosphatidate phosphatase isoform X1 n=1 Tax=Trachymyrmex septentrionalis TaxID=34720 RepID=UPI00084F8317|nr:PREDICTED: putative phosphatidate phosphatase isoform X1 [Trachymyrmex septentrionalis]
MDRSSKLIRKLIIDFLCLFVVGISVLMFFLFGKPYKRGFFCNDESLYHPYHESTVTSTMLYVIGLLLPICTMIIGEYLHWRNFSGHTANMLFGYTVPLWLWNAYKKVGVFGFGAACTVLTTDIAKYTIGRLRPHFMELCVPNIDCNLPEYQHKYIIDFHCTAAVSNKLLKEVRLSFPSGHSSFSAYTMIYLAIYLQLRMKWEGSKLLRHFLQLLCLLMAWFTAMTRISNYKHHWSDVLAGSTLGIISALVMAHCVADIFKEEKEKCCSIEKHRTTDYEAETGITGIQDEASPLQVRMQTYGGVNENTQDFILKRDFN